MSLLKRFVDEDMLYDELVKGGMNVGDYSRFDMKRILISAQMAPFVAPLSTLCALI